MGRKSGFLWVSWFGGFGAGKPACYGKGVRRQLGERALLARVEGWRLPTELGSNRGVRAFPWFKAFPAYPSQGRKPP